MPPTRGPSGEWRPALSAALAARTRAAFTALLTSDVHWGAEDHVGNECTTRDEAGEHYAGLLAAGVTFHLVDRQETSDGSLVVRLRVDSPDPDDFPPEVALRLTLRDGLISDIRELQRPANTDDAAYRAAIGAIHAGDVPTLRQLLVTRPDLATTHLPGEGGRTLLHIATDWPGHFPNVGASIATLVDAGADPNARCRGRHSETPLHWAASSDDVTAVDALLDAGADINAPGAVIAGGTPMADATAFGQWQAAYRLVERGADTNLFEAAALGLVAEVARHLQDGRASEEDITSSFWGACHGGHIATAAVLQDHGADIDWLGYDGLTPLDAAHRSGAVAVVSWLEARGASSAG